MLNFGKQNVLGVLIDAVDYETVIAFAFKCARQKHGAIISALAVHGVITGVLDPEHKFRLNSFDLLVPDGQPVRWVMNWLYGIMLRNRVYGPALMEKICEKAASEGTPIYLYGSTKGVVNSLVEVLRRKFPGVNIAGSEPSMFRRLSPSEKTAIQQRVHSTGASIVFVGLGCPRQGIFAYQLRDSISAPVLTVGAAFHSWRGCYPRLLQRCSNWGWNGFFGRATPIVVSLSLPISCVSFSCSLAALGLKVFFYSRPSTGPRSPSRLSEDPLFCFGRHAHTPSILPDSRSPGLILAEPASGCEKARTWRPPALWTGEGE